MTRTLEQHKALALNDLANIKWSVNFGWDNKKLNKFFSDHYDLLEQILVASPPKDKT